MSVECKGQNCCVVGCKSYFHNINATTPISGFIKHKDCTDYCRELPDYAGKVYSIGSPPYRISSGKGSKIDRAAVLQSLDIVAKTMHNDFIKAKRKKDYITDENAKRLKQAAKSLRSAGLTGYHLEREIDELAWFVGGDPAKILQLQHKLNQLSIPGKSGRLKEDGAYGIETMGAWTSFTRYLGNGTITTLNWVDPLKNLTIGSSNWGINNTIHNADTKLQYFRVESPHITPNGITQNGWFRGKRLPINYNHINIDFGKNPTAFESWVKQQYDHYPLSDDAYSALKDLKQLGKKVRIAGKVLLVGGVVLDALELGKAIEADLKDADKKLGYTTIETTASIGGRWAGGAIGAKIGAGIGLMAGPFAPVVVPVLAVVGGGLGAWGGDEFAKWVVDITCTEE